MMGIQKKDMVSDFEYNDVVKAVSEFSSNLLRQYVITEKKTHENIVCSPLSVMNLMYLLLGGATDSTYKSLVSVLGLKKEDRSKLVNLLKGMNKKETLFTTANAMLYPEDIQPLECYLDFVKEMGAESFKITDPCQIAKKANAWVEKKTEGRILEIVPSNMEPKSLVLMNAMRFDATWEDPYDEDDIEREYFMNYKHQKQEVNMLYSREDVYVGDDTVRGFVKSYKGGKFGFMALLPQDDMPIWKILAKMERGYLTNLYKNRRSAMVMASIPEFSIDFSASLKNTLEKLGLNTLFTKQAELANMTAVDGTCLSNVLHKAQIEVSRSGTKAAAATAGIVCAGAMPSFLSIHLNRPFIYAVVHLRTGIPVFMGMVNSVDK